MQVRESVTRLQSEMGVVGRMGERWKAGLEEQQQDTADTLELLKMQLLTQQEELTGLRQLIK